MDFDNTVSNADIDFVTALAEFYASFIIVAMTFLPPHLHPHHHQLPVTHHRRHHRRRPTMNTH